MKNIRNSQWSVFYANRVNNSSYFEHFSKKYMFLLKELKNKIESDNAITTVIEIGCGMANTTKWLIQNLNRNVSYVLIDVDPDMIRLAKKNLRGYGVDITYQCKSIFEFEHMGYSSDEAIVHSHGVLEHFYDNAVIRHLIKSCLSGNDNLTLWQVHYVPGSGYGTPSFGDERLMTAEEWTNIVQVPSVEITSTNDEKDLFLLFPKKLRTL